MTARLVRLHAKLIAEAARAEAIAARLAVSDPARAACENTDAYEARAAAADLADTLRAAGSPVYIPDRRQLALIADGYSGGIDG